VLDLFDGAVRGVLRIRIAGTLGNANRRLIRLEPTLLPERFRGHVEAA
jgi:hypothetical protein